MTDENDVRTTAQARRNAFRRLALASVRASRRILEEIEAQLANSTTEDPIVGQELVDLARGLMDAMEATADWIEAAVGDER